MPDGDEAFEEPAFDEVGADGAAGNEAAESRRGEDTSSDEEFIGECREDVPFGEIFYVFIDGKQYKSCSHNPPHLYPA